MRGTTACHRRDAHITGRPASRNWRCVRVCLFSSHSIYTSHLHEVGKLFPVMIYLRKQKPESQICISSTRNSIFLRERDKFAPPAVFVVIALHCVCVCSRAYVRACRNKSTIQIYFFRQRRSATFSFWNFLRFHIRRCWAALLDCVASHWKLFRYILIFKWDTSKNCRRYDGDSKITAISSVGSTTAWRM